MSTETVKVTGMTCDHCVHAVSGELSALPGVTAVDVDLRPGGVSAVRVTSDAPLDREAVARAVDEAGYEVAPGD
jgi:copper chaperone